MKDAGVMSPLQIIPMRKEEPQNRRVELIILDD